MDMGSLGKWAWLIGLVVLVVLGLLAAVPVDLGADTGSLIASIAVILALLGGILFLAGMKDRSGFFIAVLALLGVTAYAAAAGWDLFGVGKYVWGFLGGAAAAASAGAIGVLLVTVYEWIMSATK
ncbi:MAG: hypothetical protein WD740_04440 [Anaerolineales bacterium]